MSNARQVAYTHLRWTADALKRPFYAYTLSGSDCLAVKIGKGILMGVGLAGSLIPRFLASVINPDDYCHTKGDAEAIDITSEINVLSYNILGFHAGQAASENRSFWEERFKQFCQVIEDADADVVCLQEVHCGSWLENKLIERFKGKYSDFYGDIAPKTLMFGSGLFIMHRVKDTTLDVQRFKAKTGNDSRFVGKAFATLIGENFTVTTTHMQSGSATEDLTNREVRWNQAKEVIENVRHWDKQVHIFCGDFNEDRTDTASYYTSWLNPANNQVIDGFKTDEERKAITQADLNKAESINTQEAVDNIVAILDQEKGQAHCTIAVCQKSTFKEPSDPSDHAAMFAKVAYIASNGLDKHI
ncbi:MAG: endonuclease/exonuclease/phosphatase family protein [Chlamydiia bacterium]|nr:endonuclease/exonuclease/phosphatase family protein [Chlamydiia bacterium]